MVSTKEENTMSKPTDFQIMCALVGQVQKAAQGRSERDVTTLISRPMWNAFCRATELKEDTSPSEWLGIHKTARVYGSKTIIIERPDFWSVSSRRIAPLEG